MALRTAVVRRRLRFPARSWWLAPSCLLACATACRHDWSAADAGAEGGSDTEAAGDDTTVPDEAADEDASPEAVDGEGAGDVDGAEGGADGEEDGEDVAPAEADVDAGEAGDAEVVEPPDADGDTIADADEGRSAGTDTDADTIPDWQDADSDADTIADAVEAGDGSLATPPRDADGDTSPDFRDIDSDDNGILDAAESRGDLDGDTLPDFADVDDDGDGLGDVLELAGSPSAPPDHDGDTSPDYRDVDSDGDVIGDRDEGTVDTDLDLTPDRFDDDSDGDDWSDAEEAGDDDVRTPPVDTDGDTTADFRDPDSDGDGLPDWLERTHGTDRTDPDSDDDGASDLVEVAAGSDPLDPGDDPWSRGDFVFVVPYNAPGGPPVDPEPRRDTLVFSTAIRSADVYFLVDCTGSMTGALANLKRSISDTVIPGLRAAIPDTWVGVGHFEDFPLDPWGAAEDMAYENRQRLTNDAAAAQAAADGLTVRSGADFPESHVVALYTLASNDVSRTLPGIPVVVCAVGYFGYPCFREGAVPIVVLITDAEMHNGPGSANPYSATVGGIRPPTYDEARAALSLRSIRALGVSTGDGRARPHLDQLARDTGAVDAGGSPLVYDVPRDGTGLGDQVVRGVETLASSVPIRIDAQAVDDPSDTVDAVAAFIEYLEANASGATVHDPVSGADRTCTSTVPPPVDGTGDGHPDTFPSLLPGTSICYDIHARRNATVPATAEPQMFRATIRVRGDGITVLDEREVFFLVPAVVG